MCGTLLVKSKRAPISISTRSERLNGSCGCHKACCLTCVFEGDGKDGSVLVFWAHAGEVFWCEATVNVLAKMICCEMVCFDLVYVLYSFV
jgi:hypothetical protein